MKRLAAVLVAAAVLPLAARAGDANATAVELSRITLPEQNWNAMLDQGAQQVRQYVESGVRQAGGSVPAALPERIAQEFKKMMPTYQEMVDLQAGILVKHYTEGEIKGLLAFYRTPLGQKAVQVMPQVVADVNAYSMTLMQQRLPAMMERLRPELEQTAAPSAAQGGAAAPAKKPASKGTK